jgi:peroxiredoxin Q/BCP
MLNLGVTAPDFSAPDQTGKIHNLADYAGKWLLLYFYPKDDTPGCTAEACAIRDNYAGFNKIGAAVLGVSADTVASHADFSKKYAFSFPILSDPGKKIISAYEAAGMMTKRVSYLIDPEGKIAKTYDKVKPAEHAAEVLTDLSEINK